MMTYPPTPRQPVLFISHGGGPCFWMTFPKPVGAHGFDKLRFYLDGLLDSLEVSPTAILVVSAHWETDIVTLASSPRPPMLFDYYGFPEHTYQLEYPAPGAPDIADRARLLLADAGLASRDDPSRGFDHGVFVPMLIIDPIAQIPVLSMSIERSLDPARHLAIGTALAPLREQGILIIGSGNSYHNLREMRDGTTAVSSAFDTWLTVTATAEPVSRQSGIKAWEDAPGSRSFHPREEHLVPLMVAIGAAADSPGQRDFHDIIGGKPISGYRFG